MTTLIIRLLSGGPSAALHRVPVSPLDAPIDLHDNMRMRVAGRFD